MHRDQSRTPEAMHYASAWSPGLAQIALLGVLFFVGVKLSLQLAVKPDVLVLLWLPNGILLAALLRHGVRRYALLAAVVIVAEIAADYPEFSIVEAGLFGVINLVEVTVSYTLLRRWRFNPGFEAPTDLLKFLIAGPLVGALLAACLAGGVYTYLRSSQAMYLELVRVWWFSDATGLLIITPLVLSLQSRTLPSLGKKRTQYRWFDGVAAALGVVVIGILVHSQTGMPRGVGLRPIVLFPLIIYVAARFGPRETAIVMAAIAAVVLYVVKNGQQPFGALSSAETVLQAQQLILLMSASSLALAALLSQLRSKGSELEARVQERTAELRHANEQLQKLTLTDGLTGLLNRRALFEIIRSEIARNARRHLGLGLLILDIDRFKGVNDSFGHAAGDAVLRHVASVIARTIRRTDTAARLGGEEFVVVAPETERDQVFHLADRIRTELRSSAVAMDGDDIRVTVSIGVAMLQRSDESPEELLQRADKALYAAKQSGRDRVLMSEDIADLEPDASGTSPTTDHAGSRKHSD